MKTRIFSVYDKKTEQYGVPFFIVNRSAAIRAVTSSFNDNNMMSKHPHDFAIYDLGEYDDETGLLSPQSPQFVIDIFELVSAVE